MAKGYWISRIDVQDVEGYRPYIAGADAAISAFGGRFLLRGGRVEAPEGAARSRNVVVEFPDYEAALACFHSSEYQAAYQHRLASSTGEHLVIEGYEGDQPAAGTIDGPSSAPGVAYWVMRLDVHDTEGYKPYIAADAIAIAKYKGWFLVRGGRHEAVSGPARARNVVLAFADYETALTCYRSPEYQVALAFRKAAAEGEVIIAEGV